MDIAGMNSYDAGMRKAAILVACLDQPTADLLLDQLSAEQADLVRQAAGELEEIDSQDRQRVIDEFRRIGPMVPRACPAGIELTQLSAFPVDPTVAGTGHHACMVGVPSASDDTQNETGTSYGTRSMPTTADDLPPFDFLRDAEDDKLAALLAGERPPTVALVLSYLPSEQAGDVLAHLAPALQVEVVRRMVDPQNTDPETLREVEQALETRLSRQLVGEHHGATGPQAIGKILAACDGPMRGRILGNLATHDQELAEQLGHRSMGFDELLHLNDAALAVVAQAAEPETLQAALLGADPELVERLLRCLPAPIARGLRRKLAHPDPIRLSDMEDARQRIAALAQQMQIKDAA
jgi:flagellar motor switch protein FliG